MRKLLLLLLIAASAWSAASFARLPVPSGFAHASVNAVGDGAAQALRRLLHEV
jgi:hypothetical protein